MGRPETKLWVSLGATSIFFLLLMLKDHALASTIFPLKSELTFGDLQESLSSWDLDNVETKAYDDDDGEYANIFSVENLSPAQAQNDRTGYGGIDSEDESFQNSLQKDTMSSFSTIRENDMHESSHRMYAAEKDHSFDRILNHKISKENDDVKGNGAKKSYQKKTMRFLPSKGLNERSDSGNNNKATKTTIRFSVHKNATALTSKPVTNQSREGEAHIFGGQEESRASSQFKFPYRIPFPYVRRKFETEHKNIRAKLQNINEGGSRATNPSHRFVNGDVFLQRRNRSRRSTHEQPQQENVGQSKDNSEKVEARENVGEAVQVESEQNQQHKSSERATGSVEAYSIGEDEVAETNVRDNATSRPPTNPVEVLQRLTRLLDKMLRELSMFGQKFTLRLIRMTERQDIDQMQEIMKDYEISENKPIFFIAGGLRKLNGSVTAAATRVVTASQVVTAPNLTRNASVIFNETVENEQNLEQSPVVGNSTSTETSEEPLPLPHHEIDGTTRFPILRPSGISSLPVEYDTDNNDEETTTANPEEESETVVLVPDPTGINSPNETSAVNVTSPPLLPPSPLITRRKRSIPGFDEFQFFPIFGRSARTENPYDDGDEDTEELEVDDESSEPVSEEGRWNDEISPHRKSPSTYYIASDEMIDQSHSKRNDEISLVSDITISTLPTTSQGLNSLLEKVAVESSPPLALNRADSSSVVIPPNDSITLEQKERSNDHNPSTHAASTVNEKNTISHEEKYLPRVNPVRAVNIVNSHSSLPLTIPMQIPNLENKSTLVIDSTDEKLKADESLNLAHETSKHTPVVNLDSGNNLEISKSDLPAIVIPTLLHNNTLELLFDRSSNIESVALPKETLLGEERAFPSATKENVAQKSPLHENTFTKERRIDSPGIQQLLNPELNTGTTLNNGVVSENEKITNDPLPSPVEIPSNSSPTAESPLVTDIDTGLILPVQAEREDSIRVPPTTTAGIEATPPLLENQNVDVVAPHSVVIITEPPKSNQNDPQVEIKAKSPLTQVDEEFREPVINNLPIVAGQIKGTVATPTAEKVSLTPIQVDHVSLSIPEKRTLSSKPIASINNAVIEDTVRDPIKIEASVEVVSNVVPLPLQTEESNILLDAVRPAINPAEIILKGESIENEDQTLHNKKQSLTLVENQEDLVEDVMKKVVSGGGGEKDEIGRDKVQLIPNQATFHAPTTVLKESKIIGNNNATFLLSDKTSSTPTTNTSPIHYLGSGITTDNIDTAAVRNKEVVSAVQNSESSHDDDDDGRATEESRDGSIVVPVAIVDDEMRDLSIAAGNENVDVLSQRVVAVPGEKLSQEFVNVESILLSPIEVVAVAVPLGNSVGTVSDDTFNVEESSGNDSVDLPRLAFDRSEDVLVQPENKILSLAESVLHQDEDVRQEEIKNVPDISASAAAIDPINLVRDVTNVADTTKIESVPADIVVKTPVKNDLVPTLVNEDVSVSIPEVTKIPSKEIQVVEAIRVPSNDISNDGNINTSPVIANISPILEQIVESTKINPVEAPIVESLKVAPVEVPIVEPIQIAPVEVPQIQSVNIAPVVTPIVDSVKLAPVEIPIVESVKVLPVEAPIVESVKVLPVEAPIVESVKVLPVEAPIVESVKVLPVEPPVVELVKTTPVEIPIVDSHVTPTLSSVSNISPVEASNIGILNVPTVATQVGESVSTVPSNVPMVTNQFANPVDAVNTDTLNPIIVQTRNPESVEVNDLLPLKSESEDVVVEAIKELSSVSKDVLTPENVEKNTSADISIVPLISAVSDTSSENSHEVPVQNIPVENLQTKVPVIEASVPTDPIVDTKIAPVLPATPAVVTEISSVPTNAIGSNTDVVKPEVVLSRPAEDLITAPVVIPEPVLKVAQQPIPQETVEPVQLVNKVAQPISLSSSQPVSAYAGSGDEIGILPESDPDSHFGIKPIDTQPHFQIPGLKPSIPERPHPDYLATISQGIDTDTATLLFSPPTNPVVVPSPPVYSGYSPAAIFRKQQQMMQNYFSGLLYRRALPV